MLPTPTDAILTRTEVAAIQANAAPGAHPCWAWTDVPRLVASHEALRGERQSLSPHLAALLRRTAHDWLATLRAMITQAEGRGDTEAVEKLRAVAARWTAKTETHEGHP